MHSQSGASVMPSGNTIHVMMCGNVRQASKVPRRLPSSSFWPHWEPSWSQLLANINTVRAGLHRMHSLHTVATWAHVLPIAIITLCFHIYCVAKWQRSHIKPLGLALISQSTQHYEPGVTFLLIFKVSLACQTKKDAAGKQFVHNRARGHFYM